MSFAAVGSLLPRRDAPNDLWQAPAYSAEIVLADPADVEGTPGNFESKIDCSKSATLVPKESVESLLRPYASSCLWSFTEWREKASDLQLFTLYFYQAFVLVEVDGDVFVCIGECGGRVEVMLGSGEKARQFAREYKANGERRKTSMMQPPSKLGTALTVQDLLDWITSPMAPKSVVEHGLTKGLTTFLSTATHVQRGSLMDFIDSAPSESTRGQSFFAGMVKRGRGDDAKPINDSKPINLTVIFSSADFDSKPTWTVELEPSKRISDLQNMAQEVLGDSLARLVSQTGHVLEPGATIQESGLRDGDTVTAEFLSGTT